MPWMLVDSFFFVYPGCSAITFNSFDCEGLEDGTKFLHVARTKPMILRRWLQTAPNTADCQPPP